MNEESAPRIIDVRTVGIPVTDLGRAPRIEHVTLDGVMQTPGQTATTGVVIAKDQASAVSSADV